MQPEISSSQPQAIADGRKSSPGFRATAFAIVVLLGAATGALGGWMVAGLYQFLQEPRAIVNAAGWGSGGVFGALAGWFWARAWFRGLRGGAAVLAGLVLGAATSLLVHLVVAPARAMAHGYPVRWDGVGEMMLMWGLPFGLVSGAIAGAFCGSLLQSLEERR